MGRDGPAVDNGGRRADLKAVRFAIPGAGGDTAASHGGFSFVQTKGDSHIGFNKPANQDVTGTLKIALDKINALPVTPELLLRYAATLLALVEAGANSTRRSR